MLEFEFKSPGALATQTCRGRSCKASSCSSPSVTFAGTLGGLLLQAAPHVWQFLISKSCCLASSCTSGSFIYRRVADWHRHARLAVSNFEELLPGTVVHGGSFIHRRVFAWHRHARLAVSYIEELLLGIVSRGWQFLISKSCCLASSRVVWQFHISKSCCLASSCTEAVSYIEEFLRSDVRWRCAQHLVHSRLARASKNKNQLPFLVVVE